MSLGISLYRSLLPYQVRSQLHVLKNKQKYQRSRYAEEDHLFKQFDQHRCLFLHIPKAGGISVYRSLFSSSADNGFVNSIGHFSIRDYEIIFGKDVLTEYFKFTFVRNPWSRAFSAYTFLKKGGFHTRDMAWAERNLSQFNSFNEFVTNWLNIKSIYRALHFVPQHEFLRSSNGKIETDFIGKLENIKLDFEEIKRRLGIDCQLKHLNKNKAANSMVNYRDVYSSESKRIVAEVYRKDIEIFEYEF